VAPAAGVETGFPLPAGEVPAVAPAVAAAPLGEAEARPSLGPNVDGPDPIAPVGDGPGLGSGAGAVELIQVKRSQMARRTIPAATRIWRLRIVIGRLP
jgi:hypothetical protein